MARRSANVVPSAIVVSAASWRRTTSAMGDRQMLPVQTKQTTRRSPDAAAAIAPSGGRVIDGRFISTFCTRRRPPRYAAHDSRGTERRADGAEEAEERTDERAAATADGPRGQAAGPDQDDARGDRRIPPRATAHD